VCSPCRTPILKKWSEDNFEEHHPVMMFPMGLATILEHNVQKSTEAYEKLIGHSAGMAAKVEVAAARINIYSDLGDQFADLGDNDFT
jgi:hypothetical protein